MTQIKPSEIELKTPTADANYRRICALLCDGEIAAIPTETVYGLAADSANGDAVAKIYAAKGRPSFNPLIVHVAGIAQAQKLVHWNDRAQQLVDHFWPGALTIVMDARADNGIAPIVSAGLPTLAIRSPAHPIMRTILDDIGLNLAAPSANKSGQLSATSAAHVRASFAPDIIPILDGGNCEKGLESTIIALRPKGWEILRPGPISAAMICACLGETEMQTRGGDNKIEAPGQLSSHYAPHKPLRLAAEAAIGDEYFIGLGAAACDYNLSPSGDLNQAAAHLFAALHAADNDSAPSIAVAPIAHEGIGVAINDRLKRAAVKP